MKQTSDEVDLRSLQRRSLHDDKVTSLKNSRLASPNFLRLVYFIVVPVGIEPTSSESESEILSIEIRDRIGQQI